MTFDQVDNYSALLDVIIKREESIHHNLCARRIIEEIIGIEFYFYNKLMRGWFPDFNSPAAQNIRAYLELNYKRSIIHHRKCIRITDMPVKISGLDKTPGNRRASLILKELCKGNFEEVPLSKKARNELRRWFN